MPAMTVFPSSYMVFHFLFTTFGKISFSFFF